MPPLLCKALLFDLDGVLVDSTPAVARVWTWWARQYGFDPDEVVRRAHGRPCISTIRELLPNADHDAESREVEHREILDVEGVIPLPGVRELLDSLPADRWTIVTSCTTPLAHVRICAAGFTAPSRMVTADHITRGKPDPEPYLKGATVLGFAPRDCLIIEDAPAGVRSGKAAGARVIALQTTATNDSLIAEGADWIVKDCSSLFLEMIDQHDTLVINATLSGVQPFDT